MGAGIGWQWGQIRSQELGVAVGPQSHTTVIYVLGSLCIERLKTTVLHRRFLVVLLSLSVA